MGSFVKPTGHHFNRFPFDLAFTAAPRLRCRSCGAPPKSPEGACPYCGGTAEFGEEIVTRVEPDPFKILKQEEKRRERDL